MQYVRVGRSGLKVSRIGLGMMSYGDPATQEWALREDEARPIVRQAVEAGVTWPDGPRSCRCRTPQPGEQGRRAGDDPLCLDQGVGLIPYSPLARGLLAGTRDRSGARSTVRASAENSSCRPADFDVVDALRGVAAEYSVPPAQIALAWLLGKPGVAAAIIGATKPHHLPDAFSAMRVAISADDVKRLEGPYAPHAAGAHT